MTPAPQAGSLLARYDALLVDLDGVVHLGDHPVPAAAAGLDAARAAGLSVVFVTNNASRTADDVVAALDRFGVPATSRDVLTSSMAAADVLSDQCAPGARVLVVGGEGLRRPLAEAGLSPVTTADDAPAAVAQGWSPELTWAQLAEGAVAIRNGATWVATNADATLPSPRGPLPGNGAMVAALRMATGREPLVVGKPAPTLFRTAAARCAATSPLVIGDRLDTDIAGAVAAGLPSLLVLTGVSSVRDLMAADPSMRPTYVASDLSTLDTPLAPIDDAGAHDAYDDLRSRVRGAWNGA